MGIEIITNIQNSKWIDYGHCSCMEEGDTLYLRGLLASFRQADGDDAWKMLQKQDSQVWGQPYRWDGGTQRASARRWPRE